MNKLPVPFNISLLQADAQTLKGARPVTSLDIFDGMSKNFHNDGLYSTVIFGKIGDERRKRMFAYIDIKLSIFHPVVYRALIALRRIYGDIISGKTYAVWDESISDFTASTPMDGDTGYEFFTRHWKKIVFQRRPSDMREEYIKLIEKYKADEAAVMPNKIVVIPAGLRDFEIQGDGRYSEEEVNGFYKKLMSLSSTIPNKIDAEDVQIYNSTRMALQRTFNDIYDLFESMVKGKKKLMMGKWASRKVFNGTRNVITSMSVSTNKIRDPGNLQFNDTIIGLYQFMKATLPVSVFKLRNGFLSQVFTGNAQVPARLVDKNTLHVKQVDVRPEIFDTWMTDEGIERVITRYGEESLRRQVLEIQGYYMGLVYKDEGVFRVFQDIDDLPEGFDISKVSPLTFVELMYISVYKDANKYPLFVTRYPIATAHSIYPSSTYLKTTTLSEKRVPLDHNWMPIEDEVAYQYPILDAPFVESMSPHPSKLAVLGADFDGDTASGTAVYADESIDEVHGLFNSRRFYVGTNGRMNFSVNVDTVKFVLHNMTGDPEGVATEAYQEDEDSSFTHLGKEYNLNKIFEAIEDQHVQPQHLNVDELDWILEYSEEPDAERLKRADPRKPLLVVYQNQTYYTVDGLHRLTKVKDRGQKTIRAYVIDATMLSNAEMVSSV